MNHATRTLAPYTVKSNFLSVKRGFTPVDTSRIVFLPTPNKEADACQG